MLIMFNHIVSPGRRDIYWNLESAARQTPSEQQSGKTSDALTP